MSLRLPAVLINAISEARASVRAGTLNGPITMDLEIRPRCLGVKGHIATWNLYSPVVVRRLWWPATGAVAGCWWSEVMCHGSTVLLVLGPHAADLALPAQLLELLLGPLLNGADVRHGHAVPVVHGAEHLPINRNYFI